MSMNITPTQAHQGMTSALAVLVKAQPRDGSSTGDGVAGTTASGTSATSAAGSNGSSSSSAASGAGAALSGLGANTFLTLLVTQLQNQDPTQPMNPTDFVTQLAQFSEVSGIQQLQSSFGTLAQSLSGNQVLQAANLVGHGVMAPGSSAALYNGVLAGQVVLPGAASDVQVQISDAAGTPVQTLDLGAQNAGNIGFQWDGKNAAGQTLPPGIYNVQALYQVNGGTPQAASTNVAGLVQSVSLGANGQSPTLNVLGLGSVSLADVTQIL